MMIIDINMVQKINGWSTNFGVICGMGMHIAWGYNSMIHKPKA